MDRLFIKLIKGFGTDLILRICWHILNKYIYKLLINRTRGLYREISDRGLLYTDRARRARFVQKDRGPIFLCTYRASEISKKFIIWHLYIGIYA